jgi:hypothetical protein
MSSVTRMAKNNVPFIVCVLLRGDSRISGNVSADSTITRNSRRMDWRQTNPSISWDIKGASPWLDGKALQFHKTY